ncbi:MAG: hypothetical protein M1839_002280 [Geoglossum umbratile]|nr:MAG: hypothetical protein M1839_002280 [Geoglossum umbratile]
MGRNDIDFNAAEERMRQVKSRNKSPRPPPEKPTLGLAGSNADGNLCSICQRADFVGIVSGKTKSIALGLLADVGHNTDCDFCRLLAHVFRIRWGDETFERMASGRPGVQPLPLELRVDPRYRDLRLNIEPADSAEDIDLERSFLCDTTPAIIVKPAPGGGETCQSKQVNFGLLRTWISRCSNQHGPGCESLGAKGMVQRPGSYKVIDIHCLRVIPAPTDCRYVALSYVWGGAKFLSATRANYKLLEEDGSLQMADGQLPQTIKDAMLLLAELGERYLWVDSLCIVQDDDENKHEQISNMDRIYGNASWTLVAAAGKDANSGLPGLRPCSPPIRDVATVKGLQLGLTLPKSYMPVDRSYWNRRAWTYQERLLSRKCLIFSARLVYFQCARSELCHNWQASTPSDPEEDDSRRGPYGIDDVEDEEPLGFWQYSSVVREYTARQLTFNGDILNAFQGLSSVLASSYGEIKYHWGLPEAYFDCAILWQPEARLQRRASDSPTTVFPSWSWAGWVGSVHHGTNPAIEDLQDEVEFYKCGVPGVEKIDSRERDRKCETEPWQRRKVSSDVGTVCKDPPISDSESDLNLRTHLLLIWATSARFAITGEDLTAAGRNPRRYQSFSIFDSAGYWCGTVEITDRDWADRAIDKSCISGSSDWANNLTPKPNNTLYEFIALSRRNDLMISEEEMDFARWDARKKWGVWNVMMVQRKGDVAERVGLGKIHADAWERAGPRAGWVLLG